MGFLTQSSYPAILFLLAAWFFIRRLFTSDWSDNCFKIRSSFFGSVMGLVGPFLAISAFGPILFSRMYEVEAPMFWLFMVLVSLVSGFSGDCLLRR